tara:strand:- start:1256 stop:1879 length:624 start_codon:yes stop_codon:yes gene_type:complete
MGKRSDFARKKRDFYPTPVSAVEPLIPHLPERFTYIEPCSGDGALIRALSSFEGVAHGGKFCPILEYASDISPSWKVKPLTAIAGHDEERPNCGHGFKAYIRDVFDIEDADMNVDFFITNPPWSRDVLHPMIMHLSLILPTWLLFDADWMHTKQAARYLPYCKQIVSVGRVKWIPDSPHTGKDNCAWYLFETDTRAPDASVDFHGRG